MIVINDSDMKRKRDVVRSAAIKFIAAGMQQLIVSGGPRRSVGSTHTHVVLVKYVIIIVPTIAGCSMKLSK